MEWGDDVKAVSEDEAMVLVNHQATGDVCTLMMCLQDKGTVGYSRGRGAAGFPAHIPVQPSGSQEPTRSSQQGTFCLDLVQSDSQELGAGMEPGHCLEKVSCELSHCASSQG